MLFSLRTMSRARAGYTALLVILVTLVSSACGGDSGPPQPTAVAGGGQATPGTVTIEMNQFKFTPADLTVAAGSTVVWVNKEAQKHTVTEDKDAFDSGTLSKGETFTRKFDKPGTYSYYCKLHGSPGSGMFGRITVTEAGAGGASDTPAAEQPTQAAADATVTPTPAEASAPEATPTQAVAPPAVPTATPAQAQPAGSVRFRDNLAQSDEAVVEITTLPQRPEGKGLYAWLTGSGVPAAGLGRVDTAASGPVNLTYSAKDNANLLARYDGFEVTAEDLESTPSAPSSAVLLSGQIPPKALVHIRHLLVAFDATPNKIGLEVGLLQQLAVVKQHVQYMSEAQTAGNLKTVQLHAEHLVNIIEGAKGQHFGDLNKDGKVTNPGDGFGLLPNGDQLGYLQGSKDHAELAATAPDATADVKLHAGHVSITIDNTAGWVTSIRDKSLELLKATSANDTAQTVKEIVALANQAINGVDLKGDGQILPVPGSGGALTSYQHAQLMAGISLSLEGRTAAQPGPAPTAAPAQPTVPPAAPTPIAPTPAGPPATVTPTRAPAAAGTGGQASIDIRNFKFGDSPLTVKAGTQVTWTNRDGAQHTVTADDSSFDSGTLQTGQSFSFTFTKPGRVTYYCSIHGGPGGQGMSSTVIVQP